MSRKSQVVDSRFGYFGIGIERGKNTDNLGTLFRSAVALGASFIFTVGGRYHPQSSDTIKSWRHIPYLPYTTIADFKAHLPHECVMVGVELTDDAHPLETFTHPARCAYLLGPEDGSLSTAAQDACHQIVRFQSRWCLNVASAGTTVLYDRSAKSYREHHNAGRLP